MRLGSASRASGYIDATHDPSVPFYFAQGRRCATPPHFVGCWIHTSRSESLSAASAHSHAPEGERVGPIAKQWEGEVVLRRSRTLPLADAAAHLTLPAQGAGPL